MEEVKISETTIITPSQPPFNNPHVLPLSPLDTDQNLQVNFRYLRVYLPSPPNSPSPFHVISTALSAAILKYYPLAATLRRRSDHDHRLELFCTHGQGIPFVRATTDRTLNSVNYLENPNEHFVEQLVPKSEPDDDGSIINPCVLQLTVFNCGGYVLGASIHHSLCDGLGATQFFNGVAELARGAERVSVEPVWGRAELLCPREERRIGEVIKEVLSLEKGRLPYSWSVGEVVREWFGVEDDCLEDFKRMLFEKSGLKFTTFEALGAFLWRAKVKASNIAGEETVKFAYSTNIRKQLNPPLPFGYWGNGCVPIYVQLTANELINQPIWETAKLIKMSKANITNEYVRSFIDFQDLHYKDGITAGKEVSGFTDWRHLGHSTVDFGSGGPVTVLPLTRYLVGSVEPCFFLPYSSANLGNVKGFKVSLTLRQVAVPAFKDEMEKFSKRNFGF